MKRLKIIRDNSLTLQEGFERFIKYCKIKSLSDYTITYYKKSYRYFLRYLREEYSEPEKFSLAFVDKNKVDDFILWLKNEHTMKNLSANSRIRGLRALLYYLMKDNYIENFKIELLKTEEVIKETYTDNELRLLLEKPDLNCSNFANYRNWVIVNFLLATAVRTRSLVNIKVKDIDLDEALVHIRVIKNHRQQLIPLSKSLITILAEYIVYRDGEKDDYLFCNTYSDKLKSSSLNSAIRSYNHSRGVTKTSIHMFRHTFARKWILNGGDSFRLQKILGHKSMRMVRQYVNMYDDDLKKDFNNFNPLEEFNDNGKYVSFNFNKEIKIILTGKVWSF
jgi:integrase/recombinase XerD